MNVQLMDCMLHSVAFGALTEMSVIDLNKGYHPSPSSIEMVIFITNTISGRECGRT